MPIDFVAIPTLTGPDLYRFWTNVEVSGKCLIWRKSRCKKGYGRINIGGQSYIVSRVAYTIHFNTDPGDFMVCHDCNNPACVRKEHLYLGTNADNQQKCEREGRRQKSGMLGSRAKLWDSDIPKILEESKTKTIAELARKHSLSFSAMRAITRGETYVGKGLL